MALSTFTKACESHTPGNKELWLGLATGFTSGVITATEVTALLQTQVLWVVDIDGIKIEQTPAGKINGMFSVEKNIQITISKLDEALMVALNDLTDSNPCGIVAVYKTNNNEWFCSGFEESSPGVMSADRGLHFAEGPMNTGQELTDEDGDKVVISLKGVFPKYDYIVSDASLVTVSATGIAWA